MIKTETVILGESEYIYTYSDSGKKIKEDGSGLIYIDAYNPKGSIKTYSETDEDIVEKLPENLEEYKKKKIKESKEKLQEYLENNPYNYNGKIYSCTEEKQTEMALQYLSYQMQKQAADTSGIPVSRLTWNEKGKTCEEISEEDFIGLILGIKEYVYPIVEKQRAIEMEIENCREKEEVDRIEITYIN